MPATTKEKASELRQARQKLVDEAREITERCHKDNRALTKDEQERMDAITGNAERGIKGEANEYAERISTLDRLAALELNGNEPSPERRRSDPLPHQDVRNVKRGHKYSLMRAVEALASNGKIPFAGLEAEVSAELARRGGKSPQGFMMPHSIRGPLTDEERKIEDEFGAFERRGVEYRNLDTVTGGGSVPTNLSRDWIEILRNQLVIMRAGAREIPNLTGKFAIPRQSGTTTGYWVGEGGDVTGSNQTLDQILFTPHTVGGVTDISRRFFELSNIDGEEFVKQDLAAVIARAIDLAALNGSGSSNQPLGIMQNTGITATRTVPLGTNGAAPTWAALVNLYTVVSRGNAADLGQFAYIGNADVRGTLATTPKIGSTFPVYLLEDGKVYGMPAYFSQQLPNNLTKGSGTNLSPILGGIWNQLFLAYWSGLDVLVNPYSNSTSGTVRIVALQDMDIQVRHNEAFALIVDMISNQS